MKNSSQKHPYLTKNNDRTLLLLPLVSAIYPVASFAISNQNLVSPLLGWRLIVIFSLSSILLYFFLLKVIRDGFKTSLICSLAFLWFHAYGWVYEFMEGKMIGHFIIGRHLILFPLSLLILSFFILIILKYQPQLQHQLSKILFSFSVLLALSLLIQEGAIYIHQARISIPPSPKGTNSKFDLPDVYYIVLDGYSRYDQYQKLNFDNSYFIKSLEAMGFVIPRCSLSNYIWTAYSLSSTFQMDYIQDFGDWQNKSAKDRIDYAYWGNFIRDNPVRSIFKSLGYTIVATETGYTFSEWSDADIFLTKNKDVLTKMMDSKNLKAFEYHYLTYTAFRIFLEFREAFLKPSATLSPDEDHYYRVLFLLDQLERIPALISSPKFIYMHIVSPHEPFIFDQNGNYAQKTDNSGQAYVNQTIYLNSRILPILENLLHSYPSEKSPLIILQSDHGFGRTQGRVKNLNAYYLPNGGNSMLTPNITPVNTFRLVFSYYFGMNYSLLDDKSYFDESSDESRFELVPVSCFTLP